VSDIVAVRMVACHHDGGPGFHHTREYFSKRVACSLVEAPHGLIDQHNCWFVGQLQRNRKRRLLPSKSVPRVRIQEANPHLLTPRGGENGGEGERCEPWFNTGACVGQSKLLGDTGGDEQI